MPRARRAPTVYCSRVTPSRPYALPAVLDHVLEPGVQLMSGVMRISSSTTRRARAPPVGSRRAGCAQAGSHPSCGAQPGRGGSARSRSSLRRASAARCQRTFACWRQHVRPGHRGSPASSRTWWDTSNASSGEEVREVEHPVFPVPRPCGLLVREVDPGELLRQQQIARHPLEGVVSGVGEVAEDVAPVPVVGGAGEDPQVAPAAAGGRRRRSGDAASRARVLGSMSSIHSPLPWTCGASRLS